MPGVMPFQLICQVCGWRQEFSGDEPPPRWVVLEQQGRGCLVREYVCDWVCATRLASGRREEAVCTG